MGLPFGRFLRHRSAFSRFRHAIWIANGGRTPGAPDLRRASRVHGIPQRLAGLERRCGRGGDVQALAGPWIAPCARGTASGAEGAEAGDPHILAPGQCLRDRLEYGIHRVAGRRFAHSAPARHPAGDVRFVHPFSPCTVAFSGRPARPIGGSRGRRARLARNPRLFDPGSAVPSPSCLSAVCGVSHCQVFPRSSRRSKAAVPGDGPRGRIRRESPAWDRSADPAGGRGCAGRCRCLHCPA